ncbi:MFS transporter [Saccharothrix luteola]|uniref:MFS transporter n=1 Tax=Saccharothrix luteola TaxID=2893018 RepID=UPI001E529BAC|nr:MFS transporter [Saccharothrix luteola]MCC8246333.1 MFS transporter [Saccharothrix luteola]
MREGVEWDRKAWALLFVLSGNMLLDALEVSAVLPALTPLSAGFAVTPLDAQWVMSGFALGFALLLVPGPHLAARVGRKELYLGAMLVFAVASVVAGLTDSLGVLVATRLVKGFCAALTAPAGLAIIVSVFDGPARRRAVSVYSLFGAAGFTSGLLLSGVLSANDWHWTFLFPAPVALVLFAAGLRVIPRAPAAPPPPLGKAVLRDGSLLRAGFGAAALNGTYIGLMLLVTTQLAHLAPWQLALALLPASLPLVLAAPHGARLVRRFGTARLIAAGALCSVAGNALYLARPDPEPYATAVLPVLLLVEAGFVLSFVALNLQATATVPADLRAAAVPVYQTFVQLGSVVALPLVALLLTTGGPRAAMALVTAAAAVGAAVALTGLRTTTTGKVPS